MRVVSENINREEGKKRHYLPLETRIQLYNEVRRLRKQGLSYGKIQRIIYEKYKEQLYLKSIYNWVKKKYHPLGNVNKFDNKPSPELSYVIGVVLGDGAKCLNGRGRLVKLAVNDREFAEEFSRNLTKVLGKNKPYKPCWDKCKKQWTAVGYSILLYKFLEKPLEELKPYIEYNKDCVASFLRALFDSEGSMHKSQRKLRLYNTDKELLIYAKYLLEKYFNIETTGPYLARKAGEIFHFPNGEYKTTKDYYYLHIRAKSLQNFYKYINFTIKRKQQRLLKAIKQ